MCVCEYVCVSVGKVQFKADIQNYVEQRAYMPHRQYSKEHLALDFSSLV